MSALHGSPYWNPILFNAFTYHEIKHSITKTDKYIVLKGWKVNSFTPLTKKIELHAQIINTVMKNVENKVKQIIAKPLSTNQDQFFSINPTDLLIKIIEDLYNESHTSKEMKAQLNEIKPIISQSIAYLRGQGDIIIREENSVLRSNNHFLYSYTISQQQIEEKSREIIGHCLTDIYHGLKIRSLGPCEFNQEDIRFLGGIRAIEKVNPQKISCIHYALLKNREPFIKEAILSQNNGKLFLENLKTFGYRIVSRPDTKDLVIYINESDAAIRHMGVYTEEGLVESKWGVQYPEIFQHQVFDVSPHYGKIVIFMRKSSFSYGA